MSFAKKDKTPCVCTQCRNVKMVLPCRVNTFRYCSNVCKWLAKKKQIPVNKLQLHQRIFKECHNELCKRGRFILPSDFKLGRYKYCSVACKLFVMSPNFEVILEEKKEQHTQEVKRSIWFI